MDKTSPTNSVPNASNQNESKKINCKYCNLHFASIIWLKRHIVRNHAHLINSKQSSNTVKDEDSKHHPKSEKKINILNYKQQIEKQKEVLNQQSTVIKQQQLITTKSKKKLSPTKSLLREQLKIQLEAQKKLLQVQQEIFEKANKAQNEIYELLAKLGDDEEEEEVREEYLETDDVQIADLQMAPIMDETTYVKNEMKRSIAETSVTDAILSQEEFYVTEDYEINDPITTVNEYVVLNQDTAEGIEQPDDQNVFVVVRSDEGDEEYELVEIVEDQLFNQNVDNNEFDLEIVGADNEGVHCRIVADTTDGEDVSINDSKSQKTPVKVDVGKISMISQNHLKKLQSDVEKTRKGTENDKVLNKSIKSTRLSNEYIQKAVQNAKQTDDNKFECPICKEVVSNRYSLGPHILRLHSKQKSKVCPHCDRAFTCTGDLTRLVIHSNLLDYL